MGKYIVKSGQNLYDIALHIYGSIEGIVDLMMSNTGLSMCGTLKPGDELIYTDDYYINADIVAHMRMNNIIPANGERHVYYKEATTAPLLQVAIAHGDKCAEIGLSGWGAIEVDWGDNSELQLVELSENKKYYLHSFDNQIASERKIKIYGDARLKELDFERLPKILSVLCYTPFYIEKLRLSDSKLPVDFIMLLTDLYDVSLTKLTSMNLLPLLACKKLMRLDLSKLNTTKYVVDEYLTGLVHQYYERRYCTVILTTEPGGVYKEPERGPDAKYIIKTGMEAIWVLTHEPAWNEAGFWKFIINDKIYVTEI